MLNFFFLRNSAEKTEEVTEVPFEKNTEDADDLKTEDNFLELPAFLRLKTARKLSAAKMDCLSCRKYFSHPYIFKHQKICER